MLSGSCTPFQRRQIFFHPILSHFSSKFYILVSESMGTTEFPFCLSVFIFYHTSWSGDFKPTLVHLFLCTLTDSLHFSIYCINLSYSLLLFFLPYFVFFISIRSLRIVPYRIIPYHTIPYLHTHSHTYVRTHAVHARKGPPPSNRRLPISTRIRAL